MPSKYKAITIAGLDPKEMNCWSTDEILLWNQTQIRGDFEAVQCGHCEAKMQQKNFNRHCKRRHGKDQGDILKQNRFNITTKEWIPTKKTTKRRRSIAEKQADLERETKKQRSITGYFKVLSCFLSSHSILTSSTTNTVTDSNGTQSRRKTKWIKSKFNTIIICSKMSQSRQRRRRYIRTFGSRTRNSWSSRSYCCSWFVAN